DPSTGRVTPIAPAPSRTMFPSVGVGPDSVLVWGGHGATPADTVRDGALYDVRTNTWRAISSRDAPSARYAANSFFHDGRFVVRAGVARGVVLADDDGAAYDPRSDRWGPLDRSSTEFRPFSNDGGRIIPFDYGFHYVLGPAFRDVPGMAGYAVNFRAPDPPQVPEDLRLDSVGSTNVTVMGQLRRQLWVGTRDLRRTWRMPLRGPWEPLADELVPASMEGRTWRAVWTGRRLVAWGGLYAISREQYDCSGPCPPGAPCMEQMCTRTEWGQHADGIVYTPVR
ncbi:MAG: hypothetical protein L0206_21565, partial [Actinobacteria bacterium]|nr:hypothetical protein [Actinomycetota bacterium]